MLFLTYREVSAGEERFFIRCHGYGKWPAAAARHGLTNAHVHFVYIRALLSVNFDGHQARIQHRSGPFVLKALVRHHVAPVAG